MRYYIFKIYSNAKKLLVLIILRSVYNINKYKLDIKFNTDIFTEMPYDFDTYYIWIETPDTECKILELLKNYASNNNKKYNIIIAYNTVYM